MDTLVIETKRPKTLLFKVDRPGWIPSHIQDDWDTDPYAYQTEEELMPAGGLHGLQLAYLLEVLRLHLKKRGLMLLLDTFMLYRDKWGGKQRIAPDLLLMPFRFPPPSAYDLDIEPPPLFVAEVTSIKSRLSDLNKKVSLYFGLGIPSYLVLETVTPIGQQRKEVKLHGWELVNGLPSPILPNATGGLTFPQMGLSVQAEGLNVFFVDLATGERLRDIYDLTTDYEELTTDYEELTTDYEAEHQTRLKAEQEIVRLKAELAKLQQLMPG